MRTIRVEVRRSGEKSLITEDRMRVAASSSLRAGAPTVEGVAPAQRWARRPSRPTASRNLLEVASSTQCNRIAAARTMGCAAREASRIRRTVLGAAARQPGQNGILLDSVSADPARPDPVAALDEKSLQTRWACGAAEIIAVNKKKRAEVEAVPTSRCARPSSRRRSSASLLVPAGRQAQIQPAARDREKKGSRRPERSEAAVPARGDAASGAHASPASKDTRVRRTRKQRELRSEYRVAAQSNCASRQRTSCRPTCRQEARAQARRAWPASDVILAQEQCRPSERAAVAGALHEISLKRVNEAGEVAEANAADRGQVR